MLTTICVNNCASCFAMLVCANKAIVLDDGLICVDSVRCIACGSCKKACVTFGYKALANKSPRRWGKSQDKEASAKAPVKRRGKIAAQAAAL